MGADGNSRLSAGTGRSDEPDATAGSSIPSRRQGLAKPEERTNDTTEQETGLEEREIHGHGSRRIPQLPFEYTNRYS